ncbi:hypothetical protein Cgig2_028216 [Carnegiea gigantea]|uniref:Uncharacterized protein n=1 Tax=Carnegiea gigantea TaxID=171969 RepID=A0A9Q1JM69_9CARY|nr:hypothetical protein Cgig2_028216 [Carnegiea gigantea]
MIKKAIADPQSAHMEFRNLQLKDKVNNDSGSTSFSPTLRLHKPDSEDQISRTILVQAQIDKRGIAKKDDEKRVGAARTSEKLEEVGPSDALRKRQPKNLPLAYSSLYVILLTKQDSELSQDELVISEYVFSKVEDVDDGKPLFDGCGDKEATRVSIATLKPGQEFEMNVINI